MTSRERSVGFEISRQQSQALEGADASAPHRTQVVVEVAGGIDLDALPDRAAAVVEAYEILRTTFVRPVGVGRSLQVVQSALPVAIDPPVDVATTEAFDDACRAAWIRPLDTDSGPTIRVTPITRPGGTEALVMTAATAVADDASLGMLAEMLQGTAPIDTDPLQYADYAAWQKDQDQPPDGSAVEVPTTLPQSAAPVSGAAAAAIPGRCGCADATSAGAIAHQAEVSGTATRDVWVAIWSAVVSRLSGTDEVTVGLEVSGRSGDEDLVRAIGPLAGVIPITVAVPPKASIADLARSIAATRERSGAVDAGPSGSAPLPPLVVSWREEDVRLVPDVSSVQFHLVVGDHGSELWWNPSVISDAHGAQVARTLGALVSSVVTSGLDAPNDGLDGCGPGDDVRIDGLSRLAAGPLVHRLVAEQARRDPDRPALAVGDSLITYGRLDRRSNVLAADLVGRGIGPGDVVGVLMDRSIEQILAVLGVLGAGAAHLCLNADQPVARLIRQLDQAGVRIVIALFGVRVIGR